MKGFGRNERLRIGDIRNAYSHSGHKVDEAEKLAKKLEDANLLTHNKDIARDHYTLTDLAWSRDDFTALLGE